MITVDASNLALFWAGVIAFAILVYVILDGFDLGVGILTGAAKNEAQRDYMVAAIAPFWDGNETWLVVIGASLFAAFPKVYAVFLPAFYIPVLLLLLGLIFRGVAFEFRYRGARKFWNRGFFLGSAIAAFVQGAAVGAMIRGIPVVDGQYAGGAFEWLAPLPVLCGVGLMLGYALLGAGWLVMKCEGELQEWARQRIPWLAVSVAIVVMTAFQFALLDRDRIATNFIGWGLALPILSLVVMAGVILGAIFRSNSLPFVLTVAFFIASLLTLALLFWPYMIPYTITIGNAAAPDKTLSFFFWGAGVFVLPVIVIYTAGVYWVFRGKFLKDKVSGYGPDSYTDVESAKREAGQTAA